MIYFDNAATTGIKPQEVIKSVNEALKYYSANPGRSGHTLSVKTASAVYRAREKIASFFGADGAENVVFTANCTLALNYVIKGTLKKGDHVIVSSAEHNAVMRPLVKTGVSFDKAAFSFENDDITVSEFEKLIKPETKMIICTGASNVFGNIMPLEKLGKLCRRYGLLFAVDGAQTAGVLSIDMKKMDIDYLCVAPHKGLYAPMGTGILIAREKIDETIVEGGTGTNSAMLVQPEELPERLESGTLNVPGIIGISAGIDHVARLGTEKIYSHELKLISMLYEGLSKMSYAELYTPFPEKNRFVPVLSFNISGVPSEQTAEYLSRKGIFVRGGLHCAPTVHEYMGTEETGTVRVSVSIFNGESEIKAFLNAISVKNIKKFIKTID